jgi:hypothetical protein
MRPHLRELVLVERPWLAQHAFGHGELADVVEGRTDAQHLDLVLVPAQPRGHDLRERRHTRRVSGRVRVTHLDRPREVDQGRHRTCHSRSVDGSLQPTLGLGVECSTA